MVVNGRMTLFGETGQDLSAGGETVRTALMNNMSSLSSVSDQVLGVRFVEGSFATTDTSGSTDPNSGGDGNDNNGGGGLPVFAYVLIGAGTLVLLIIILVVVLLRRNRRSDESTGYGRYTRGRLPNTYWIQHAAHTTRPPRRCRVPQHDSRHGCTWHGCAWHGCTWWTAGYSHSGLETLVLLCSTRMQLYAAIKSTVCNPG